MLNHSLLVIFPGLHDSNWRVTSPATPVYNCIAWAASDESRPWWPVDESILECFWPADVEREETLPAFIRVFQKLGFDVCDNDVVETGMEKIAIFAFGDGSPCHAARQLPGGLWSSKLGELEDIEHELRALEGTAYGSVAAIMRRSVSR